MGHIAGQIAGQITGRLGGPVGLLGALVVAVLLGLPGTAGADDGMNYALILDDEGVVINVAVYDPATSASWLEAMESKGAHVVVLEQNTVGIGSVLQPDGSFARERSPVPSPEVETPSVLPSPGEGEGTWQQHGVPGEPVQEQRLPVIRDRELAKHLGVAPADEDGTVQQRGSIRTALIIENGVVVNAAVYHTVDSVGWLDLVRSQGMEIVVVPEHSAGIGWIVQPDGSVIPPAPRPGLVWNGSEWRAPGTEDVERPSDVRGWSLTRSEDVGGAAGDTDVSPGGEGGRVSGLLVVPDEALEGGPSLRELAERSIVLLESSGDTLPFLARFEGLPDLVGRLEPELDAAIAAHEAASGEQVDEAEAKGLREAARRLAGSFLRIFGLEGDSEPS